MYMKAMSLRQQHSDQLYRKLEPGWLPKGPGLPQDDPAWPPGPGDRLCPWAVTQNTRDRFTLHAATSRRLQNVRDPLHCARRPRRDLAATTRRPPKIPGIAIHCTRRPRGDLAATTRRPQNARDPLHCARRPRGDLAATPKNARDPPTLRAATPVHGAPSASSASSYASAVAARSTKLTIASGPTDSFQSGACHLIKE
jgi:hypothetical protein